MAGTKPLLDANLWCAKPLPRRDLWCTKPLLDANATRHVRASEAPTGTVSPRAPPLSRAPRARRAWCQRAAPGKGVGFYIVHWFILGQLRSVALKLATKDVSSLRCH